MIELFKKITAPYRVNIGGWYTNRKIVVFESDDWGSVRMSSAQVYNKLLEAGYRVKEFDYERYDSLASEADLTNLFDLLASFKDHQERHPVFTANTIVANPDFEKIRGSGFKEYHYELFTETLKKYPAHSNSFKIWNEGINENLFFPQFHGREHLNVSQYLKDLRSGDKDLRYFFDNRVAGAIPKKGEYGDNHYVDVLKSNDNKDKKNKIRDLLNGLDIFESLFGYKSLSFIPPNYMWYPEFNKELSEKGVRYFQGRQKMRYPGNHKEKEAIIKHALGDVNQYGQLYLTRNIFFEPTKRKGSGEIEVEKALRDVAVAFKMGKPAIISTHRLNYIGFLNPENSSGNLKLLRILLKTILKKWPDVEFLNSVQLGEIIREDR